MKNHLVGVKREMQREMMPGSDVFEMKRTIILKKHGNGVKGETL